MTYWTDEQTETLKRMRAERCTFSEVAYVLGNSRSACIGKANWMGLASPPIKKTGRPPSVDGPKRRAMRLQATTAFGSQRVVEVTEFERIEIDQDVSPEAIPQSQRKTLLQLQSHHCRWPYGEPSEPDFFFCGAAALQGHSYCQAHCRQAYGSAYSISDAGREAMRANGRRAAERMNAYWARLKPESPL